MLICTLSTQRSGTKALSSIFTGNNEIATTGEIFSPDALHEYPSFCGYINNIGYSRALSLEWKELLRKFFLYLISSSGRKVLHFDVMYNQLFVPTLSWTNTHEIPLLSFLKRNNCQIIHLTRNPLDVFLSQQYLWMHKEIGVELLSHPGKGMQTLSSQEKASPQSLQGMKINLTECEHFISYNTNWENTIRKSIDGYASSMHIDYEGIVSSDSSNNRMKMMLTISEWAARHGINMPHTIKDNILPPSQDLKSNFEYHHFFTNFYDVAEIFKEKLGHGVLENSQYFYLSTK